MLKPLPRVNPKKTTRLTPLPRGGKPTVSSVDTTVAQEVGSGVRTNVIDKPWAQAVWLTKDGKPFLTPRGYAGVKTKQGFERDHQVSVAAGGSSTDIRNIDLKESPNSIFTGKRIERKRQEGKVQVEKKLIDDYKAGKIGYNDMIVKMVAYEKQEPFSETYYKELVKSPITTAKATISQIKKDVEEEKKKTLSQRLKQGADKFINTISPPMSPLSSLKTGIKAYQTIKQAEPKKLPNVLPALQRLQKEKEGFTKTISNSLKGQGVSNLLTFAGQEEKFGAKLLEKTPVEILDTFFGGKVIPGDVKKQIKNKLVIPTIKKVSEEMKKVAKERLDNNPEYATPEFFSKKTGVEGVIENLKENPGAYTAHVIGSQSPTLAAQMAMALTAGGSASLVFMGLGAGGETYEDAIEHGVSENKAVSLGIIRGSIEGALEQYGLDKILKPIGTKQIVNGVAKNLMNSLGDLSVALLAESGTEGVQELVANAIALTFDENRELFNGVAESAFAGLLLGGVGSTATSVAGATKGLPVGLSLKEVGEGPTKLKPLLRKNVTPKEFGEAKELQTTKFKDALEGEIGMEEEVRLETNLQKREDISNEIVKGIKNNPYWKKEKSVKDIMGEGYLMSREVKVKGKEEPQIKYVVVEPKQVNAYTLKGYKKGLEIDTLAQEAGFDSGIKYLENQIELSEIKTTPVKKIVTEKLLKDKDFKQASEVIEKVKGKKVKQSTLLLSKYKAGIKQIQNSTKSKAQKKIEIQRLKNQFNEKLLKQKRESELKVLKTGITQRIKGIARGIREGRVQTKQEIKATQKEVIDILNQSKLETKDKAKFLATIKNIQTTEQLKKAIPIVEERVAQLETKAERRQLKSSIKKELKTVAVKKVGGKPVGKFTPAIQNALDKFRTASRLTQDQADAKIQENLVAMADNPDPNLALENKVLSLLTGDSDVAELNSVLGQIQEMKTTGSLSNELKKFNIESEVQTEREFVIDRITGGKGIKAGKETFGKERLTKTQQIKQNLKSLGKQFILDWQGQMKTLDFNNHVDDQVMAKRYSTLEQDNKYKELENDFVSDFDDAISQAYGIKNQGADIHKQLGNLSEIVELGTFKNAEGVEGKLEMTRDELIKRWMEMQDDTLTESLIDGNKYTREIMDAIEGAMTINDKKFANKQFELYEKQWRKLNPVYSEMYGVDLPFNPNYSPIRREGFRVDEQAGVGEFLSESAQRVGLTSKSFISRVKNSNSLATQGSVNTLSRHIKETNYFIAWAKQIRKFNAVFKNPTVKEAINQEFGGQMNQVINTSIDDMTTNGNRWARTYKIVDSIRKKFTVGALMLKPSIGIKQMVSTLAYLERLSPFEFTTGVADFWKHPIKNTKILNNESTFIKTRGQNLERDIKAAMDSDEFKRYSKKRSWLNTAMLNVKLGDKGAILTGAWAMRKAALRRGEVLENAIKAYEEFGSETQQSSDLSRLSSLQRSGNSLDILFTMFKSSQRQYFQKEVNAIKSVFKKGGATPSNIKKVAKILAIYHVLLPVTFQYIANLGGWDEEDRKEYLRAGILGSVNGLFIYGDVVDGVLRAALGLKDWGNELSAFQIADPIKKAMNKIDWDDITDEDMREALGEFVEAGNWLGVPVKQTKNFLTGINNIMNGNVKSGVAELLGWSPFFAEKESESKEEDKKASSKTTTKKTTTKLTPLIRR